MSSEMTEVLDAVWLDEQHPMTATEIMALSGLCEVEIRVLVDCEALQPIGTVDAATDTSQACFSGSSLALARAASRLRHDFDLDDNGLGLVLQLFKRIQQLEGDLLHLRAQWPAPDR